MKYAFGGVSVDADTRSISSAEGSVHLTRKAFDLLLLLLECRSKVVSKDDIYARLWPDSFVTESSLQTLVHEIRHAIDHGRIAVLDPHRTRHRLQLCRRRAGQRDARSVGASRAAGRVAVQ